MHAMMGGTTDSRHVPLVDSSVTHAMGRASHLRPWGTCRVRARQIGASGTRAWPKRTDRTRTPPDDWAPEIDWLSAPTTISARNRRLHSASSSSRSIATPAGSDCDAGAAARVGSTTMSDMSHDPLTGPVMTYDTVGVQLRAPRVAVVFEGDDHWQIWGRDAMRQITASWAGAGFVLVPHHGGTITADVAAAVQRYDPDFVVAALQPWRLREALEPGAVRSTVGTDVDDALVDGVVAGDSAAIPADAQRARDWLARHCTPYSRLDDDGDWEESEMFLSTVATGEAGQLPLLAALGVTPEVCRAVPGSWGGSVATAASGLVGTFDVPDSCATTTGDDAAVLASLLGAPHGHLPNSFLHSPTGIGMSVIVADRPTALGLTEHGLDLAWRGAPNRITTWVVGDTSDDFALAMILHRAHGQGAWIHPSWADDPSAGVGRALVTAARASQARGAGGLIVMSTSLDEETLEEWKTTAGIDDEKTDAAAEKASSRERRYGPPAYQYTVRDQHDRSHTLPLIHARNGTIELASAPPLPTVEPGHPLDNARVPIQVDLLVPGSEMPTGRGFDAHVLARDEVERWTTWMRSSRTGVSYQSERYDLVQTGATKYGRLATPRLCVLGLGPWVEHMAQQGGYTLRTSDPGRRTDILAQLWGGREAMASAVASPVRDALAAFTPPKQDRDSYLHGGAVRLTSGRGVLNFDGVAAQWPDGTSPGDVRAVTDDLLERRILRRGLLLRCPDCSQLDFFAVDQLAQRLTCALCGSGISLVQENWKLPVQEPLWYYDAHPAARSLVPTNSDLPLILGHHLSRSARRSVHIGELELVQEAKAVAETDLVAWVDNQLIVAEVKANTNLAAGKSLTAAVAKRVLVAKVLCADQIVLATSKATSWPSETVETLIAAIEAANWFGRPPKVRLITGLTSNDPLDVTI